MRIAIRVEQGQVILDGGPSARRGFTLSPAQAVRLAETLEEASRAAGAVPDGLLLPGSTWQVALERHGGAIAVQFVPPTLGAGPYCVIRPATALTVARLLRVHARRAHETHGAGREVARVLQ